ncbi:MAG TPA: hypothetical protein VMU04_11370 [Candidatus Acidoferrum sp.]|nr:hypothetical protein [Candidatus Acidoferrum sp.]
MKHRILLEHIGENSTTSPTPIAGIERVEGDTVTASRRGKTFTVSLAEQKTCCMSFDNDMLVTVTKYHVAEIEMPDWMTPDEYVSHHTSYQWYVGFGAQPGWPRQWFFRLKELGETARFGAIKLLNVKKFRSPFRMSLRSQLEAWLNDPHPQYSSPFSSRQWESLLDVYTCREAKSRSNNIYWAVR